MNFGRILADPKSRVNFKGQVVNFPILQQYRSGCNLKGEEILNKEIILLIGVTVSLRFTYISAI
jgi:hypothetical protein